jgi:hypothetical protein
MSGAPAREILRRSLCSERRAANVLIDTGEDQTAIAAARIISAIARIGCRLVFAREFS